MADQRHHKRILNIPRIRNSSHDHRADRASGKASRAESVEATRKQSRRPRSLESVILEMHRFVRDVYESRQPPAHRAIVFDEAQRAWSREKNHEKYGRDLSEPEMVLEIMGRHTGWSLVVGLVGGGQEIHAGEAGLAAWGHAQRPSPGLDSLDFTRGTARRRRSGREPAL